MQKVRFHLFLAFAISIISRATALEASKNQWKRVNQLVSYNLMKTENVETHNTKLFRHRPGLHVRHNYDLRLALQRSDNAQLCDEPYTFKLIENDETAADSIRFTWTQRPVMVQSDLSGQVLYFNLYVNRSIPVGKYILYTSDPCSDSEEDKLGREMIRLGDVFMMFNPASEDGEADHDMRMQRQATSSVPEKPEYIDNNCGYIWVGNTAIPWNYAVGSQVVTDSTNALVQMMTPAQRSDKVLYSRALSELVGSRVVHGRWNGIYDDGMDPTQWVGSEAILTHWLRTKRPVRYGQCWVFAAILTTILRASGILARTVTNYDSHHDRGLNDDGTAVLRQYDNIVQPDESTWNFHVWSEAWLERPDLRQPAEWNAVDATPQEPSPLAPGQPYRAGPAYVPHIRADMRNADYDNYFILAEVNARKICPQTGRLLPSAVGTAVVTKKPGMNRQVYNDMNPKVITSNYKFPTASKRATDAAADFVLPRPYVGCERDGGMRLNITPAIPTVGDVFIVIVTEGNMSAEDTIIRMELMSYMGESLGIVNNFTGIKELNVTEMDYFPFLRNSSIFRFTVGTYNETGDFAFHDALHIRLNYERLQVQASKDSNSSTIILVLTYTNPLSIPMTGVVVSISSPNSTYARLEQSDIPANAPFTATVKVECGDNDDDTVMIPISLDSDVTQSVYGMGWSSCSSGDGPSNNGGHVTLSVISGLLLSLFAILFVIQ